MKRLFKEQTNVLDVIFMVTRSLARWHYFCYIYCSIDSKFSILVVFWPVSIKFVQYEAREDKERIWGVDPHINLIPKLISLELFLDQSRFRKSQGCLEVLKRRSYSRGQPQFSSHMPSTRVVASCANLFIVLYFFLPRLDMDTLARFTLSVRKGYRPVAYHNFSHAFAVAHSMCVIMKMASDIFTCEEVHPLASIYGFLFFCLLVCEVPSVEILHSTIGIKFKKPFWNRGKSSSNLVLK